jgi:hypothetical protein
VAAPPPPSRRLSPRQTRSPGERRGGTADAALDLVTRRLGMLAAVAMLPGGLVVLCALACVLLLMRSEGGRRALNRLEGRIPPRVKEPLRKVLLLARGEQVFLRRAPPIHSR